jgi:hypothetical protein
MPLGLHQLNLHHIQLLILVEYTYYERFLIGARNGPVVYAGIPYRNFFYYKISYRHFISLHIGLQTGMVCFSTMLYQMM